MGPALDTYWRWSKMLDPDPFSISIFNQVRIIHTIFTTLNLIGLQASLSKGSPLNCILIKFVWLFFISVSPSKSSGVVRQNNIADVKGGQLGPTYLLSNSCFWIRIRRRKQWCGFGVILFPICILYLSHFRSGSDPKSKVKEKNNKLYRLGDK